MSGFDELPTVRFTVEGLKTKVLHALSMVTDDLSEHVRAEVEKAVKEFNWERHVRELAEQCIRSQLEHYFKFGEGYHQIKSAIEAGFSGEKKQ